MTDKTTFWKGVSAGVLAGMGIATALLYLPVEKWIAKTAAESEAPGIDLETMRQTPLTPLMPDSMAASLAISSFFSRRDQPESAGDPSTLASARTGTTATFLRTGGPPGGRQEAEFLEVPGRPGERIDYFSNHINGDHIDLSRPLRVYPRSLDIGSSG